MYSYVWSPCVSVCLYCPQRVRSTSRLIPENADFSVNDTITITFNKDTNQADLPSNTWLSKEQVDRCIIRVFPLLPAVSR